jgi:hypothetical protein
LDENEKGEILSMIPSIFHPKTSITPIPPLEHDFLLYSTDWSESIRLFTEDVKAGRYAPRFRAEAEKASRDRTTGKLLETYQQGCESTSRLQTGKRKYSSIEELAAPDAPNTPIDTSMTIKAHDASADKV